MVFKMRRIRAWRLPTCWGRPSGWASWVLMASLGFMMLQLPARAQNSLGTPSAEQMIEQLRAPPSTRSLRNLQVEPVVKESASASTPALGASDSSPLPEKPSAPASLSLLIQFDFDSARVKSESQQAIGNLAIALKSLALSNSNFLIEGHTDATGRSDYNLKLSQDRAEAVRSLLVGQGVARGRLQSVGKGSSEPSNARDPFAAENRRVRIVNLD